MYTSISCFQTPLSSESCPAVDVPPLPLAPPPGPTLRLPRLRQGTLRWLPRPRPPRQPWPSPSSRACSSRWPPQPVICLYNGVYSNNVIVCSCVGGVAVGSAVGHVVGHAITGGMGGGGAQPEQIQQQPQQPAYQQQQYGQPQEPQGSLIS